MQKGAWEYDIVFPGYKCNMTDVLAAIGLAQLNRYEKLLERRREVIGKYDHVVRRLGIETLEHFGEDFSSTGHLYLTRIPGINEVTRNEIISRLAEKGISCNVHYKPLPMLTAYKNMGFRIEGYPNAFDVYQNEITLPLHTLLDDEDVAYIGRVLESILAEMLGK